MTDNPTTNALPEESLFRKIHRIRDQKVLLDVDLAELYGVDVRTLKQAVRRNIDRFPDDFMFELTDEEWQSLRSQFVILNENDAENLRSQFVTSSRGKHSKFAPFAFTEQGVAMLSSVLNSKRAVEVNIQIMRVFVKMRQWVVNYAELLQRIEALESEQASANGHIAQIYNLIKELLEPEFKNRKPIGFHASNND